MRLPARLPRPKLGVRVPIQKIWPRHRRWVRAHGCCVPGCHAANVDFAHLRSAANAGTGQMPHDIFGVSLCRLHHDEQHRIGADAFNKKYGVDLWTLAAEFARRSPDWQMRASLKLISATQTTPGEFVPGFRSSTGWAQTLSKKESRHLPLGRSRSNSTVGARLEIVRLVEAGERDPRRVRVVPRRVV